MNLLLHACCGPCSLEPLGVLRRAGHSVSIAFVNANIAPEGEYTRRLDTLRQWAASENVPVIEGAYLPQSWEATAGRMGEAILAASDGDVGRVAAQPALREARCRACYRLRFREVARLAAEKGFDAIGTTLSVSPYQFSDLIREELTRAACPAGVKALFEDYRPYYDEATRRSRALGMYRQNYCGCRFSEAEAEAQRTIRKQQRQLARQALLEEHAEELQAQEAARERKIAERQAYAEKQASKRATLKALREQQRELSEVHRASRPSVPSSGGICGDARPRMQEDAHANIRF